MVSSVDDSIEFLIGPEMQFNSYEFILFFFTLFALYNTIPAAFRKILLVIASITFYSYWKLEYTLILFTSLIIDYSVAIKMESAPSTRRKQLLFISVITNLSLLMYFKYTNFFVDIFNQIATLKINSIDILLPIGISFYTFQTLSYSIDVYNQKSKAEKNFLDFSLFVTFFPQLIAGPIERAGKLLPQLKELKTPPWDMYKRGVFLIFWGFFIKLVIGDNLTPIIADIFNKDKSLAWYVYSVGGLLFFLKVYADFLGYSEIARGLACLFGVKLTANFKRPFLANTINEFWRRWHITLSNWIRDYVYIPLRKRYTGCPNAVLLVFTMGLFGFWHGASWNFILFGASQGFFIWLWPRLTKLIIKWRWGKRYLLPILSRLVLIISITIAALCFYLTDLGQLYDVLISIIRFEEGTEAYSFNTLSFIYAMFGASILLLSSLNDEYTEKQALEKIEALPLPVVLTVGLTLMTLTLLIGALGGEEFVYFAF